MSQPAVSEVPSIAQIAAAADRPETRAGAIDLAIKALENGVEDDLVLRLVAEGLEEDGLLEEAVNLADRATVAAPASVAAWLYFSRLLLRVGLRLESIEAARAAIKLDPASYEVQLNAASALVSMNEYAAAAEHAQLAHDIRRHAPEPLSTLAIISARVSEFSKAREFAERAVALQAHLPGAEIVLARVEIAQGQPGSAIIRLRKILGRLGVNEGHRAEALTALGDALDAADRPAEAFVTYAKSNALMARQSAGPLDKQSRRPIEHARSLERYFQTTDKALWRIGAGDDRAVRDAAGHVFLVGFPRSGTTLLENALARHPKIVALEEADALARCAGDLLGDEAALDRLARLGADEADACREIYWSRVRELLTEPLAGQMFVDKMPISTIALPFIAKVFPSAKILFARRDPRDVVLSCFRRLFGVNPVMAEFLALDSAARYYDQVMRLADLYARTLALPLHIVRHEEVVADFDGELGKALAFVGLEWSASVRDFAGRAAASKTPSATQLAQGLNAKGVAAWRRFAPQLAPVIPILEPWVERFGYPPTTPINASAAPDEGFAPSRAQIVQALQAGNWPAVFALTDKAFASGFNDPLLLRMRAIRYQQEGRVDAAVSDFSAALVDSPGDIGLLSALGLCLARAGRPVDALARLDEAIALEPDFVPAHFNRGYALESLGDVAAARRAYERAATLDPAHVQAIGALAVLAARAGDWTGAATRASEALSRDPLQPAATMAMADVDLAANRAEVAEKRIRTLLESTRLTSHERAIAGQRLGDTLDHRARYGDAFAAYEAGAQTLQRIFKPNFAESGRETSSVLARRLIDYFSKVDADRWRSDKSATAQDDDPVFVVGFPRSGTTLAAQVLGRHPNLISLDESDPLGEATRRFFGGNDGLGELERLDSPTINYWREVYGRHVRALGAADGQRVVDKMPMNMLALPLIAKLFPSARVLFLRRDPRDVVLSCFRRQFVINPTTIDLLSLDDAARLYDLTMTLMAIYQQKLDLNLRIQRHEDLVGDFEGETRAICAFIGVTWDPALMSFADRAGHVATPSSSQIAKGLSNDGVGHWRNYRAQLAPVLPLLTPWVEAFGYPVD